MGMNINLEEFVADAYAGITRSYSRGRGAAAYSDVVRDTVREREGMGNGSGVQGQRYSENDNKARWINDEYIHEEHHGEVLDSIRKHLPEIEKMRPVSKITGNEFQKTPEDNRNLRQKVNDYFNKIGNAVFRNGLGNIALNNSGVRDSLGHGYGKLKAATFACLPDVLRDGKIFSYDSNFQGRDYGTYFIAAPVTVGGETCYLGALVIEDNNTRRYKVHEVLTIKSDGTESFKTGDPQNENRSRDNVPSKFSISDTEEKSNTKIEGVTSRFDDLTAADRAETEARPQDMVMPGPSTQGWAGAAPGGSPRS